MDFMLEPLVEKAFREQRFADIVQELESLLAAEEGEGFKDLIGNQFSNLPEEILGVINDCINKCSRDFDVKAVYLAMNAFSANPQLWWFQPFAYDENGFDMDDPDWLGHHRCDDALRILTGLEAVQAHFKIYYADKLYKDHSLDDQYEIAQYLVISKFVELVAEAMNTGSLTKEVLVTVGAHGYDLWADFFPNGQD